MWCVRRWDLGLIVGVLVWLWVVVGVVGSCGGGVSLWLVVVVLLLLALWLVLMLLCLLSLCSVIVVLILGFLGGVGWGVVWRHLRCGDASWGSVVSGTLGCVEVWVALCCDV